MSLNTVKHFVRGFRLSKNNAAILQRAVQGTTDARVQTLACANLIIDRGRA